MCVTNTYVTMWPIPRVMKLLKLILTALGANTIIILKLDSSQIHWDAHFCLLDWVKRTNIVTVCFGSTSWKWNGRTIEQRYAIKFYVKFNECATKS